jgi:transcriptional regulator GlxA family with amidase domain
LTAKRRPRIALLAAPEASASVLFGLYDVLGSVGMIWPDMTAAEPGDPALDVFIVAAAGDPFRCSGGVLVEPRAGVDHVEAVDVAIVGDIYTPSNVPLADRFGAEIEWLRRMHAGGAVVTSVCTGSLLLAATGLLDGRSCAGHWSSVDRFRADHPRVRFDPAPILDLANEADRVITAGGGTSWHELALHVITRYCGPLAATQTAKIHLLAGHEDGQLPFSSMTKLPAGDAVIDNALAWIGENLAVANPVTRMIGRSGLTPRTFARRFMAATRRRPIEYVHGIRIEQARTLLETGVKPVDDVGFDVGYQDPTFFRRLFKRTTGLTPASYRRKYAAIAGASA